GAPIPPGADCVVPQEKTRMESGLLHLEQPPRAGGNIRRCAEELKKGTQVLAKGQVLHSRAVGFLSSLGVAQVCVHPRPKAALFVTGSELVTTLKKAGPGKIMDANTPM